MTGDRPSLRTTPFHIRAADANRRNGWTMRNGVTLATCYDDTNAEALGARRNVAVADISWRWRIQLEGARSAEFLSRLVTRDVMALSPGASLKALWLADGGGVRGAGVVARLGKETFQLAATAPDNEWVGAAAASFGVKFRDVSAETGGLAVIGRYARETLDAAELVADIEPQGFRKVSWRGIEVTLSRWGHGYEIWCEPDDSILVWDRLMRAGSGFGVVPAGTHAMDVLDCEAGVPRPEYDYAPARDANASAPGPRALGLETLIDIVHLRFNGRAAHLAARDSETRTLTGVEIAADTPAPFTPLTCHGDMVGHTLRSVYSPSLRRAIALASVDIKSSAPGTVLSLILPPSFAAPMLRPATARVAGLPLLARAHT
jgi:aminomethyltransferase